MSYNSNAGALRLLEFSSQCGQTEIYYQILRMQGSIFVWVGNEEAKFDQLVAVYQSRLAEGNASVSNLIGASGGDYDQMAIRLQKRIGQHVLISVNLSDDAAQTRRHVEDMLVERLSV